MINSIVIAGNAVPPMFLIIGTGYLLRRMGWLDVLELPKLNMVGFRIFLPCHLFAMIYRADFQSSISVTFLALIVVCVLFIFAAAVLLTLPVKNATQRGA